MFSYNLYRKVYSHQTFCSLGSVSGSVTHIFWRYLRYFPHKLTGIGSIPWRGVCSIRQYCCSRESYENPSQRFYRTVSITFNSMKRKLNEILPSILPRWYVSWKYLSFNLNVLTGILILTSFEVWSNLCLGTGSRGGWLYLSQWYSVIFCLEESINQPSPVTGTTLFWNWQYNFFMSQGYFKCLLKCSYPS